MTRSTLPSKRKTAGEIPKLLFGNLWEYDPAPETADPMIRSSHDLFIGGDFVRPRGGKYFQSINPADETVVSRIALAGMSDVDRAFAAAGKAFSKWSKTSPRERGKYLFRISRLLQERSREFAVAETIDGGKPIRESRDFDLPMAVAHFFHHAGWADKLTYAVPGTRVEPLGVVGQVIPWNFPLLMLAWKIAPALATGNCVVLKPAETTSVTALKFAEILREADLPPGVVNMVTGGPPVGRMVINHPQAAKIAFTGSTGVGREILKNTARFGGKTTLELGGKAANIVFADAAVDQAVEGIVDGIFFNQGHVCCAGSRLLAQEQVADEVVEKLMRRMEVLRVGNPLDKNTDIGAVNSSAQLRRIKELVASGEEEGAVKWQPPHALPGKGWYYPPTLLTGVSQSHRVAREEIFGPVLSVLTFRTPEEALAKANNTPHGLSAGVWTEKGSLILKMAKGLQAGVVWANCFNRFDPASPFGGYKESGFGREGGPQGIFEYVRMARGGRES